PPENLDRLRQARAPFLAARPDEGAKKPRSVLGGDVHRIEVDPAAAAYLDLRVQHPGRDRSMLLAAQDELGESPPAALVDVGVAVPEQVQTRGRAKLEQIEPPRAALLPHRQEGRQQGEAAL